MSATPFILKTNRRNKSGRVGVWLRRGWGKSAGQRVRRSWYVVQLGSRTARFSVDALGEAGAWREAIRVRERFERALRAERAAHDPVAKARKREKTKLWKGQQAGPLNDPAYQAAWYRRNKDRVRAYWQTHAARENARRRQRYAERRAAK